MVAEPTPIERERREVDAVVLGDGWTACTCGQRFGFGIVAVRPDARVKCPNSRCGAWVRLTPPERDRVSRVI